MTSKEDEITLAKEIKSWKGFEYALLKPNAILFNKMLKECRENEEYASASRTKGLQYCAELLFMDLKFQQQKMISELIKRLDSDHKI